MGDSKQLHAKIVACFIAVYFALILLEIFLSRRAALKTHSVKECLADLGTGLIHLGLSLVIPLTAQVYFLNIAYKHSPFNFAPGIPQFVIAFLLTDLFYYLQHRLNHEWDIFWAFHQAHHTSQEFNLFTGIRVSWVTPFIAAVFLTPIAFLGIRPEYVMISVTLVFYGQWWCHTSLVGKLGVVEKVLNTPSSHRVHHSPDGKICRHNYAGFLILWDRLFGTYRAETEVVREFGTSYGYVGYNPFVINLGGFKNYILERVRSRQVEQEVLSNGKKPIPQEIV